MLGRSGIRQTTDCLQLQASSCAPALTLALPRSALSQAPLRSAIREVKRKVVAKDEKGRRRKRIGAYEATGVGCISPTDGTTGLWPGRIGGDGGGGGLHTARISVAKLTKRSTMKSSRVKCETSFTRTLHVTGNIHNTKGDVVHLPATYAQLRILFGTLSLSHSFHNRAPTARKPNHTSCPSFTSSHSRALRALGSFGAAAPPSPPPPSTRRGAAALSSFFLLFPSSSTT